MHSVVAIPKVRLTNQVSVEMSLRKAELMYMSWYVKMLDLKEKGNKL